VSFLLENWMLILVALTSGGLLLWPTLSGGGPGRISTAEAVRLINREKALLIDVSEPAEFASGHAVGARNVPLSTLEGSKLLPTNKTLPLIVICPTGTRAGRAAAQLRKLGHAGAVVLAGGTGAWREASLPVEKAA
jgi:rhodanese-related sulfurtransferase